MCFSSDQQGLWPGRDTAVAELEKDTVTAQADTEDPGLQSPQVEDVV